MLWLREGQTHKIPVDFVVDGEFVIAKSTSATVYNAEGQTLSTVMLAADVTQTSVEIDDDLNQLAAGNDIEARSVEIKFANGVTGQRHSFTIHYMLHKFVPLTVGPEDVRSLLGLHYDELPDEHVDLLKSYFALSESYGEDFTNAFGASAFRTLAANHAVVANAALALLPSIRMRAAQAVTAEDQTVKRFGNMSLEDMEFELSAKFSEYLTIAMQRDTVGATLVTLGTATDAITG